MSENQRFRVHSTGRDIPSEAYRIGRAREILSAAFKTVAALGVYVDSVPCVYGEGDDVLYLPGSGDLVRISGQDHGCNDLEPNITDTLEACTQLMIVCRDIALDFGGTIFYATI